jgi:ATP-dependent DNA ligase
MVRREGGRVRCFTRNGHDRANRFPAIVDAVLIKAQSFLIDGEAVIARRRRDSGLQCAAEPTPGP